MNIGEELDKLAAEGRISSFNMICMGGRGWQAYVNVGTTGSQMVKSEGTPSALLAKIITDLPALEAYDRQYGAAAVAARAKVETKPVVFDLEDAPAAPEPAGVFD